MLYLALAIICSASIALIFKHSEGRNMNRYAVTTANYVVAVIISVIFILVEGDKSVGAVDLPGFFGIFQQMIQYSRELDREFGQAWAIVSGLFAGFVFFLGFIYYQISVRRYGRFFFLSRLYFFITNLIVLKPNNRLLWEGYK